MALSPLNRLQNVVIELPQNNTLTLIDLNWTETKLVEHCLSIVYDVKKRLWFERKLGYERVWDKHTPIFLINLDFVRSTFVFGILRRKTWRISGDKTLPCVHFIPFTSSCSSCREINSTAYNYTNRISCTRYSCLVLSFVRVNV